MKYKIVTAQTAEDLTAAVNKYLDDGWEPIGGALLSQDRDRWENERKGYSESQLDVTWAQTLVKRADPEFPPGWDKM